MDVIRPEDCLRAVRRGIEFLRQSQQPSGEFPTYIARDRSFRDEVRLDSSVFATAHIVSSLVASGADDTDPLVQKAADFLWEQRLPGALWKFWTKTHPAARSSPPDLDDTSVVSMALRDAGRDFPQWRHLLLSNHDSQGRFFTWVLARGRLLRTPRAWSGFFLLRQSESILAQFFGSGQARPDDVDAVVNANTITWFAPMTRRTGRACDWIVRIINEGTEAERDRYYQSREALHYAVVRGLRANVAGFGGAAAKIVDVTIAGLRPDGSLETSPLRTALGAVALAELRGPAPHLQRAVQFLLSRQNQDGSWTLEPFYYGGWKWRYCWGSAELTTSFCLEAIGRYLKIAA